MGDVSNEFFAMVGMAKRPTVRPIKMIFVNDQDKR
jgi:hypothetical protein